MEYEFVLEVRIRTAPPNIHKTYSVSYITSFINTSREGLRQVYDGMYKFLSVTHFGGH